jgi:Bacterial low temperature requirement A protein (LtrA)
VLAVLWWVWASFAWLTNTADMEADIALAVMLFATASLFVAALAVPAAFDSHRLVFGSRSLSFLLPSLDSMRSSVAGIPCQHRTVLGFVSNVNQRPALRAR